MVQIHPTAQISCRGSAMDSAHLSDKSEMKIQVIAPGYVFSLVGPLDQYVARLLGAGPNPASRSIPCGSSLTVERIFLDVTRTLNAVG